MAGNLYITSPVAVDRITTTVSKTLTVMSGATLDVGAGGVVNNGIIVVSDTIYCEGDWDNSIGLFTRNTSTIIMDGAGLQLITGSVAFHNLLIANTYAESDFDNNNVDAESMTLTGQLLVEDGQFQPATNSVFTHVRIHPDGILKPDFGAAITVKGDWINYGTFIPNNGTVNFDSAGQSISGSTAFYNLVKSTTTPDTLVFEADTVQSIENGLSLEGTSQYLLVLRSDSAGKQFGLSVFPGGTQALDYLDIQDADASGGDLLTTNNSVDSGNNSNWEILADVIVAQIRLWLEAAYDMDGDSMRTSLNTIIPYTSPYFNGDISVDNIPTNVVDWVAVELRSAANGTAVDSVSMFLTSEGNVVMPDGSTKAQFSDPAGDYYVVIRHRNHLPVMSAEKETFKRSGDAPYTLIDLTNVANIYGDGSGIKELETAVYGLFSGETNASGIITNADKDAVADDKNLSGYYNSDTNFSGIVTYSDKDPIVENKNQATSVP